MAQSHKLASFRLQLFNHPHAQPPSISPRAAHQFKRFVVINDLSRFATDSANPIPSASAASFFQLLHAKPHRLIIDYSLSAPYLQVTLSTALSDYRPCRLVSGCEALRFILWHVSNAKGSAFAPCGFEGCDNTCTPVIGNRTQFQLQKVFQRAALKSPTIKPSELPKPPGNSPLLGLPFDVLLRIACMLPARDHATLSATHPYLRKFLASVVPGLKLRLYPHQMSALNRMAQMEEENVTEDMPLMFEFKVCTLRHAVIAADLVDGSIYELDCFPRVARPRGGLLCDEPGLGKTITTLSHILKTLGREPKLPSNRETHVVDANAIKITSYTERITSRYESLDTRRKSMSRMGRLVPTLDMYKPKRRIQRPNYFQSGKGQGILPVCGGAEQIYLSRATLIVVPSVLTEHWKHQIDLHVEMEGLSVLRVHSHRDFPDTALELAANYDIIIVPFEVIAGLHCEIRYGMPMLLKVHFYRVIVDEGHRISSSHVSNFAVGCDKIKTDIRWVMTGTPTPFTPRTDVDHLYSLLTFIRDEAYGLDKDAWRVGIRDPYMRYKTESLDRLSRLLESVMIRTDKSVLKAKCHVRNVFLNFSADTAASYNGLIRMGWRNLITSDWFHEDHEQSLLNKRNKGSAHSFVFNLRRACCFGGSMDVRFYTDDVIDVLLLLQGKYKHHSRATESECFRSPLPEENVDIETGEQNGYDENYLEDLLRRRNWYAKIRSENRSMMMIDRENPKRGKSETRLITYVVSGKLLKICKALLEKICKCSQCHEVIDGPFVTPCAHLLCYRCLVSNRTSCAVSGCPYEYEMGRNQEPKDLIELQPCFFVSDWVSNWDTTESAKMRYLVNKIAELPKVEVWEEGCSEARLVRPKVIIHSEYADHLKLAQLYLKGSEALQNSYIDIVRNQLDKSDFVKKFRSPAEYSRKAIKAFAENENASILLMNSRLGAVGLDLSFVRYIFLLEPLWDSAQEMQIISRAHRIGCVDDIVVERLIMRGSIEEAMLMELQNSVNCVEEGSAAGMASAKIEKDHQKRRNMLLNMRLVKSMEQLERDGQEAGLVAKMTETNVYEERAALCQGHTAEERWDDADGFDVRRQVTEAKERKARDRVHDNLLKRRLMHEIRNMAKQTAGNEEFSGRQGHDGILKRARRRVRFDDEEL